MKTIFITGSSTETGIAAARLFAAYGWKVIATVRDPEKAMELAGLDNVTLLPLDVTNQEQIVQTAATAIGMGEIDLVFNNAAYDLTDPLEPTSDEHILRMIDANLLGVIRITKAFIPYFRNQQRGLFISTSSCPATKWALEGWSASMAVKLKRFGIGIKTVSSGGVATGKNGRSPNQIRHEAFDGVLSPVTNAFADVFSFSTADQIAAAVYEAATDGRDQLRYLPRNPYSPVNFRMKAVSFGS